MKSSRNKKQAPPLLIAIPLLLGAILGQAHADLHTGKPAPDGMSSKDWQGIRAAYEAERHAFHKRDFGWTARNPGQQWTMNWDDRGFLVKPEEGNWTWGLELKSYGYSGQEVSVPAAVDTEIDGGKLVRTLDGNLQEWFVNDVRGLEQGWTIAKQPKNGPEKSSLRLNLAVRGSLYPANPRHDSCVSFDDVMGTTIISYSGLKAWDADGRALAARFENFPGCLRIVVEDEGARYPVTVDPLAQEQAYVKASNTGADDKFGYSIAISGDTVVVGARDEDSSTTGVNSSSNEAATNSGAAYVFVRSGGIWMQQAYLKPSNTRYDDFFGSSVCVSGDTVVVGAPGQGSSDWGAAYVFVRSGGTWSQQAFLNASNPNFGDNFGYSVAISGETVVVGATDEDSSTTGVNSSSNEAATNSGAAFVFVRSGGSWSQQAYLKASNTGEYDQFGNSVAISDDTLVVGAIAEDSGTTGVNSSPNESASGAGAGYVFMRSGGSWSQQAYLKASNTGADDKFGYSVAISGDTVAVGARDEDSSTTGVNGSSNEAAANSGAAYVFVRGGGSWSQQAYLKASNTGAADKFGYSVAISGDTVVVGARDEDSSATGVNGSSNEAATDAGAAYVFERSGSTWTQQTYLKASNTGEYDQFGSSVAISGDTVVVGALGEDSSTTGINSTANNSASGSGSTYVYDLDPRYALTANGGIIHGSISGLGLYSPGATAHATAIPDTGYIFTAWNGDATGSTNPVSIVMVSDRSLGATFSPDFSDSDLDGLSNYDEAVVFGTDPDDTDTDNDGLTDGFELGIGRYTIVTGNFTWAQAEAHAGTQGGTLATFTSQGEWDRAMLALGPDALVPYTGLWIGASDATVEGTWTWVTGEPFSFTNWATSRPDGTSGNGNDFVEVSGGDGGEMGKWYDRASTSGRPGYILETGYSTSPTDPDCDDDGLNDGAEITAGSNPFNADSDDDNWGDGAEVEFGGNPIDPASAPRFAAKVLIRAGSPNLVLRFPSATGQSYVLKASTFLSGWESLESGIPGTGNVIERTIPRRGYPNRFFKVGRE